MKAALERGYIGTMDVYEYTQTTSTTTHRTSASETKVLQAIPCRLSHSQNGQTSGDAAASVTQTIRVFFDPAYSIKPGSKLVITQNGITGAYKHSGIEAVYDTHKEVNLDVFERWA